MAIAFGESCCIPEKKQFKGGLPYLLINYFINLTQNRIPEKNGTLIEKILL